MSYVPVIGLEIHAELLTKTKIFCSCKNDFGGEANSRVCPVCCGFPGTLPNLNREALKLSIRAGLALDCTINTTSVFERKNYFYPDLPKGYQITQLEHPICQDGYIEINEKKFRINRIQLEEDAGKLIHIEEKGISLVDYNRCGIGLIEIVTEPDFNNADDVVEFIKELSKRLKYARVCDAKLQEGSIRVDVNISLKKEEEKEAGIRAEIKNLNSLKAIHNAIEYEIKRQTKLLENNDKVELETRRFDEKTLKTYAIRLKKEQSDYRFFKEPDIPPITVEISEIEKIKKEMPKMPDELRKKFIDEYKLSKDEAEALISDVDFCEFYESVVALYPDFKTAFNIMTTEVNRNLNLLQKPINKTLIAPESLATLIKMLNENKITMSAAKEIIKIMFSTGEDAKDIAVKNNLLLNDDEDKIKEIIKKVLLENEELYKNYSQENTKLFKYFMGQVIKSVPKSTNPKTVRNLLDKELNSND